MIIIILGQCIVLLLVYSLSLSCIYPGGYIIAPLRTQYHPIEKSKYILLCIFLIVERAQYLPITHKEYFTEHLNTILVHYSTENTLQYAWRVL